MTLVKALDKGFDMRIGNGCGARIGTDKWGFKGLDGEALRFLGASFREILARDLWLSSQEGWNGDRFHNTHGLYLTNSTYSWLLVKDVGFGPHNFFWRLIWKLKILPKICVFAWRIGHEIIPTNVKISFIKRDVSCRCPRCKVEDETVLSTLRECPRVREVLVAGGLDNRLLVKQFNSCIDWLEDSMRTLDKKSLEDLFIVLWNICNSRSNFVFRGKEEEALTVWDRACQLSNVFRIHNLSSQPILPHMARVRKWEKSLEGFFKINVNASVNNFEMGLGIITRDLDGFVLEGRGIFKERAVNLEWAKLDALFEGISLARCLNLNKVNLEIDCASIVNRF
ncbi:hypothetical protein Gohar_026965 [Gossypium harknessii]|uniref:Reverse transcriptase zinc-binding domain-containing protein n=1 Tax=Gossypium harknessii TaxID=34285 RepID=A0A7J9HTT1_9ROSI|nr:hypothetical protein [Gossypium harknessii]